MDATQALAERSRSATWRGSVRISKVCSARCPSGSVRPSTERAVWPERAGRCDGMRDIVATIQAEQDEIIRLDHPK
jgi:hypothetical protein